MLEWKVGYMHQDFTGGMLPSENEKAMEGKTFNVMLI